eukprot:888504-Amorphochlora_amoeboformis.AAC.1
MVSYCHRKAPWYAIEVIRTMKSAKRMYVVCATITETTQHNIADKSVESFAILPEPTGKP